MDGERLTKPLEIELLRALLPAGQPSPPPVAALKTWMSLGPSDIEKRRRGEKLTFNVNLSDEDLRTSSQSVFFYAVRTLTRGFRSRPEESALSNVVQVKLLNIPSPVQNLAAITTEHAIEVSWAASGPAITSYRVYRSDTNKPESYAFRGESHATNWQDADFKFGQAYFYKVTAVVREAANSAESEDSAVVEIIPRDTFPPAPPKGLTAVYTGRAVELIWNASLEPDLAGYNVYRRSGDTDFVRLNTKLLPTPIFRDNSVAQGKSYSYRVTALDLSNNESPPSAEVEVEAQ